MLSSAFCMSEQVEANTETDESANSASITFFINSPKALKSASYPRVNWLAFISISGMENYGLQEISMSLKVSSI